MSTTSDLRPRGSAGAADEPVDVLAGSPGDHGAGGGSGATLSGLFDGLWRFFINMRTGLWLILALGLLSFAGSRIEQVSEGVRADPAAYTDFVTQMSQKYGGWAKVFDVLGFYSVFSTWYFKALTLLLCASILACSTNRAPRLWKIAKHPRLHMGETFFTHAPLHDDVVLPEATAAATAHIEGVLKKHHFTVTREDVDGGTDLYADRFRFGPFGTVIAHLSFVLLVLGFVLSAMTGFKDEAFVVPVGVAPVAVGHDTGLSVVANSFEAPTYDDGMPKDYVADITLFKNGTQVARQEVRVNDPLRYEGIWFHQSSFGIAQAIKVTDATGKVVYEGAVPQNFSSQDGAYQIGLTKLPGTDLSVYLVTPASGQVREDIKAGQLQLEIHQGQSQADPTVAVIDQGVATKVGDLTYTYERSRPFTQLIVRKDPGTTLVWIGSSLFILGLVLVFFFPHRRIWLRLRPTEDGAATELTTASTMKRDKAFEPQFHELMTQIQIAGTPGATAPATDVLDARPTK